MLYEVNAEKENMSMANLEILNDTVVTVPILVDDDEGNPVPMPVGDVPSVISSDPTKMSATIGATAAGAPAVVLTPLVRGWTDGSFTVTDSAGLQSVIQVVDIVENLTPAKLTLDVVNVTTVSQPVPAS
jgi:hypothetical protein